MGLGYAANTHAVNGTTACRKGEYFRQQLCVANGSAAVWTNITVTEANVATNTGNLFVAQTPETFTYDADGNLLSDGRWNCSWDAENRLVAMSANTTVGPQISLAFQYDWQGRRVLKQVWSSLGWQGTPTNRTAFVYDQWNLIAELNTLNASAAPTLVRSYVWGLDLSGSEQGAGGVGGLLEINDPTNGVQFVAYDGNGNVAGLAGAASGASTAAYEYGLFGELYRASGPMAKVNPFRFSTKYRDGETDLAYYGFRYLSPSRGGWLSRDPSAEIAGANLFAIANNDTCNRFDLLGFVDNSTCDQCGYSASCTKERKCKIKSGPKYTYTGKGGIVQAAWFKDGTRRALFGMQAEFILDPDNGFLPCCCEVRQQISWTRAEDIPPVIRILYPKIKPNEWVEDFSFYNPRGGGNTEVTHYGHRKEKDIYPSPAIDEYWDASPRKVDRPCGSVYEGQDTPSRSAVYSGEKFGPTKYRLLVIDTCNGDKNLTPDPAAAAQLQVAWPDPDSRPNPGPQPSPNPAPPGSPNPAPPPRF
jgi:RHS repeat-associated protein